jgi:hypothetical protein
MRSVSTTTISPVGKLFNVGLGIPVTAVFVFVFVLAVVGALGTSSVFTAMVWLCPV